MQAVIDSGKSATLRHVHVIARAAPAQKLALVRALQAHSEIVAVTGDGVNDVPALQAADIGIAMGERGTRSAREVASIVLLDDNFRTIVQAIAEGRQLFRNLQLSFHYILMIHIPLVITAEFTAKSAERAISRRWPDGHARVVDTSPASPRDPGRSERVRADVIVLGWRGHGAVRRLLTGSVSRGVVRAAPCAVLIVRRPLRELRHVVVGVDGSENAERAVKVLATLEPPRGARATVFRAVDIMHAPAQGLAPATTRATVATEVKRINEGRRAAARKDLARATTTLSSAGWRVDQVVTDGAPLRELLETVSNVGADLLVLGVRGVTGFRHLLLDSVAEGALNRSPVPVLVAR